MSDEIKDSADNVLVWIPITGLVEGQDSQEVDFNMTTPRTGMLSASHDDRVNIFAKVVGGIYQNIDTDPIDLSVLSSGVTNFKVYAHALSPIEGLERIPISVTAGESKPAGWSL